MPCSNATMGICGPWVRLAQCLLCLCLCLCLPATGHGQPPSRERFLEREHGLARLGKSNLWVVPLERQLRQRWRQLPKLKEQIQAGQKHLDTRIEQNRQLWEAQRQTVAALRKAVSSLSSGDPKRRKLELQIEALLARAVEPAEFGKTAEIQGRLVRLTNSRHGLALSVFWIREKTPELAAHYQRLEATAEVTEALDQLGSTHRLGPARDYAADLGRLEEYEPLVLTSWVPLYGQSGHWRFGGIVAEQLPVTWSWHPDNGQAIVTHSVVQAAGLELLVEPGSPAERTVGGRKMRVGQITIPALRFGSYLLQDVPAWVLPPEGEDLGNQIGPQAVPGGQAKPERLRIEFPVP